MDIKALADKTKLFLLDMDGTVYLGTRWIEGAREFLDKILATGREYAFVTNNSTKDTSAYLEKLSNMGLVTEGKRIIISSHATAQYLAAHFPGKTVFVLGTPQLKKELTERGIPVCEDDSADVALVSFDTDLDYRKMCIICDLVRSNKPYIATHPDFNCPTETGFIPDSGANIAFIKASADREPDAVIGKPQPALIEYAMNRFRVSKEQTAMIGDRLYTDVKSGLNAGCAGVLTLSGETTAQMAALSDIKPDLIINSVADITPYL